MRRRGRRGGSLAWVVIRVSLHRLSCLSGHNEAGHGSDASTHAACHMRRCPLCLSHWLPLINSQGLSAGRRGADSWMRRSGMPRYSVVRRAQKGWGVGGGGELLQIFARRNLGLRVHMSVLHLCGKTTWMQLCRETWILSDCRIHPLIPSALTLKLPAPLHMCRSHISFYIRSSALHVCCNAVRSTELFCQQRNYLHLRASSISQTNTHSYASSVINTPIHQQGENAVESTKPQQGWERRQRVGISGRWTVPGSSPHYRFLAMFSREHCTDMEPKDGGIKRGMDKEAESVGAR